jgi:hypothetical protein
MECVVLIFNGKINNKKQIKMAKIKTGRKPKQDNEKMLNAYRLAFTDEDNLKLEHRSKQMLGHVNVGMYIRALVLREINNEN